MAVAPTPLFAVRVAAVIDRLGTANLRVHALTSPVAAERTANTLLALRQRPSLTVNPDDIGSFVSKSDALLINLGMCDREREIAAPLAVAAATRNGAPWVLDPVFVNLSPRRRDLALKLLAAGPAAIKSNSEEAFLLDAAPPGVVRIRTDAVDVVTLGDRRAAIDNGHPMAQRVTAMGCALGAVIAACLAVEEDRFLAVAAAVAAYAIAVERAAAVARGPGSFAAAFYDALSDLDGAAVASDVRFS